MTEIELKFNPEFIPLILSGKKVITTRMKPKGKIGDTFDIGGKKHVITYIHSDNLRYILRKYFYEGFKSKAEFHKALEKIYPEITLDSVVWVHYFEPVKKKVV